MPNSLEFFLNGYLLQTWYVPGTVSDAADRAGYTCLHSWSIFMVHAETSRWNAVRDAERQPPCRASSRSCPSPKDGSELVFCGAQFVVFLYNFTT